MLVRTEEVKTRLSALEAKAAAIEKRLGNSSGTTDTQPPPSDTPLVRDMKQEITATKAASAKGPAHEFVHNHSLTSDHFRSSSSESVKKVHAGVQGYMQATGKDYVNALGELKSAADARPAAAEDMVAANDFALMQAGHPAAIQKIHSATLSYQAQHPKMSYVAAQAQIQAKAK
jgi:hypothetical protein